MNNTILGISALTILIAGFAVQPLSAQPRTMAGPPGFNAALSQLFGEHKAFTAEMTIEATTGNGPVSFPGKLSLLDGKTRIEFDVTKAQGSALPPQAATQMKAMGMGETVILFAGTNSYLIYPGLKAYTPLPEASANKAKPEDYKITRTDLGRETMDGHACKKQKIVIKDPEGKEHPGTVWLATDMKDFPVVMEFEEGAQKGKMKFGKVNFEKPAANLFVPAEGFTKYASMQEMMASVMRRQFGGQQQP